MCDGQNRKLKGPAKKRQKNSNFPVGKAPSSVKKYIRVKNSHIPDTGIPKQPDLRLAVVHDGWFSNRPCRFLLFATCASW